MPLAGAARRSRLPPSACPATRRRPLVDCAGLASALGVGRVLVKVESHRLGLPAFKMLGASWATYRDLVERLGHEPEWSTVDELADGRRAACDR